jgi:hypothetical protein
MTSTSDPPIQTLRSPNRARSASWDNFMGESRQQPVTPGLQNQRSKKNNIILSDLHKTYEPNIDYQNRQALPPAILKFNFRPAPC